MTHRNPYGSGSHFTGLCETQRALWIVVDGVAHPLQVACLWSCGVPLMTLFFLEHCGVNLEASGKLLESAWQQAATGGPA